MTEGGRAADRLNRVIRRINEEPGDAASSSSAGSALLSTRELQVLGLLVEDGRELEIVLEEGLGAEVGDLVAGLGEVAGDAILEVDGVGGIQIVKSEFP